MSVFSKPVYNPNDDIQFYKQNMSTNILSSKPPRYPKNELVILLTCLALLMYFIDYIILIYYSIILFTFAIAYFCYDK